MRRTDESRGDWKEWRRRRAWKLARLGWSQKKIAEALGVTEGAVSQWMKVGRVQGEEGLRGKIAAGPQPQLSEEQMKQLPMLVRTYAPVGQTPILKVPLTRDHLSAIGGITPAGRIFMQMQEYAYRSEQVVEFLRMLLRKIRGKLLVIWDGSPIHRSNVVKEFLAAGAARRLHLERFPGYALELNPQEGIWNLLKRRELKNRCCSNLSLLRGELIRAKERLRHRKEILQSCVLHALGAW